MKRFECWILCHLVLNEELRQRRLSSPRVYPKIPETGVSFMHHFRPQQPPCSQHMWWYRNKLKRTLTLACSTEKRKNYIKIQKKKKKPITSNSLPWVPLEFTWPFFLHSTPKKKKRTERWGQILYGATNWIEWETEWYWMGENKTGPLREAPEEEEKKIADRGTRWSFRVPRSASYRATVFAFSNVTWLGTWKHKHLARLVYRAGSIELLGHIDVYRTCFFFFFFFEVRAESEQWFANIIAWITLLDRFLWYREFQVW